jgi:hypothetical protein
MLKLITNTRPEMKQTTKDKGVKQTPAAKFNFTPLVPDDHGAYVMLLFPLVVGIVVGIAKNSPANHIPILAFVFLSLLLLAAFFAHAPLEVVFKPNVNDRARHRAQTWLVIYGIILAVCGISLLLAWQLWGILWLALPALVPLVVDLISRKSRKQRSLGVRLTGIGGLVLSAPAGYYVATGKLDTLALGLWAVNLIYYGSSLFYVRVWFEARRLEKVRKPGQTLVPDWLLKITLIYHSLGLLLFVGLALWGILPWTALLAFAPLGFKLGMALRRPPINIPIKQVGLFELSQSLVFTFLLILALR